MVHLSSNIPHYHHTAEALAEEGILTRYHTSWAAFPHDPLPWYLPRGLRSKLEHRVLSGVPRHLVTSHNFPETLQKLLLKTGLPLQSIAHELNNSLFQRVSTPAFDETKVFHFVNTVAGSSAEFARSRGLVTVCDMRQEHPAFQRRILSAEAMRRGQQASTDLRIEKRMLRELAASDIIIVPSNYCKSTLTAEGFEDSAIFVIPYGVDLTSFPSASPRTTDTLRLLFVGNMSLRKGVLYLLEAMRMLRNKSVTLTCVGTMDPTCRHLFAPYEGQFDYVPNTPKSELYKYYQQADVFVLPSIADAYPLGVLEAAASAVPVITTERVGTADLLRRIGGGLIVKPECAESLAVAVEQMFDESTRRAMSAINLASRPLMDWKYYKDGIRAIYRDTILPMARMLPHEIRAGGQATSTSKR